MEFIGTEKLSDTVQENPSVISCVGSQSIEVSAFTIHCLCNITSFYGSNMLRAIGTRVLVNLPFFGNLFLVDENVAFVYNYTI